MTAGRSSSKRGRVDHEAPPQQRAPSQRAQGMSSVKTRSGRSEAGIQRDLPLPTEKPSPVIHAIPGARPVEGLTNDNDRRSEIAAVTSLLRVDLPGKATAAVSKSIQTTPAAVTALLRIDLPSPSEATAAASKSIQTTPRKSQSATALTQTSKTK